MSRKKSSRTKKKKRKQGVLKRSISFVVMYLTAVKTFFQKRKIISQANVINLIFILVACAFIYRLYDLQVVRGAEYRERIDAQYTKEERGKSISRGDIFFTTNWKLSLYFHISCILTAQVSFPNKSSFV